MKTKDKDLLFVNYLFDLTDDVGIFQHSIYGIPDRGKGYTTDDNVRALILAVKLFERFKKKKYLSLVYTYLAFVLDAQNENGKFKNFMDYNREFIEDEGSEDCFGRCIWAIGYTISSKAIPKNIQRTCWHMMNKALKNWQILESPRAQAYSIVGLSYLTKNKDAIDQIKKLSESLVALYGGCKDTQWNWFEDSVTYGNSFFPMAMYKAFNILKKDILLEIALESMGFLEEITFKKDYFKPIGCNGWLLKGKEPAAYDEQPLEACETLLAYLESYKVTKNKKNLKYAKKCFNWYKGENSKRLSLIDKETGACYDGLTENGLNLNQGSECIVSYGIAYLEISKYI